MVRFPFKSVSDSKVLEWLCSLFKAKACSLGQKLLTLRVIYYELLNAKNFDEMN